MRKRALLFVLGAAVALSGCASWHGKHAVDRASVRAKMCANWRWIGVKTSPAAVCPIPRPGWTAEPLFVAPDRERPYGYQQEPPSVGTSTDPAMAELNRFCVYETEEKRPRRPPVESPREAGLVRLDRDCAAISPASYNFTAATWQQIADHSLQQAGMAPVLNIENQEGVRLAFLDTQPTGEDFPPAPPGFVLHGFTLAHLARRLVCSPAQPDLCAAKITTRLATPFRRLDPDSRLLSDIDTVHGGRFGTQQNLAQAIYAEVDAWQAARSLGGDAPQHLVLNLSLAWDPQLFGGLGEKDLDDLEAGTRAIYEALRYAQDQGAMVVAAAGNKRDCELSTDGPALPAAWEQKSPPDPAHPEPQAVPLVYAVGGVRSDNSPLHNARPSGMPKRVAYGEHLLLPAAPPAPPPVLTTWRYTGSSIATAIVSATAGLVWDSFPGLSRERVMDILYESGKNTSFAANFWFGGGSPPPTSRRISTCAAVAQACLVSAAGTAPPAGEPRCPLPDDKPCPELLLEQTDFPSPDWEPQPISSSCHPWLVPQPEDTPCPPCNRT